MTNFQAGAVPSRRWITPERAVLVLPVLAGVGLAVLLLLLGLSPLLLQVQKRSDVVVELERKSRDLPLLRRQLDALLQRQARTWAQQEQLLELVAGTGALNTWLAQLNRLAFREGVAIQLLEPQAIELYVPPPPPPAGGATAAPAPAAAGTPPPASADPLLAPNLEKRSAVITVQGPFPKLVAFLQHLELLQMIVIASEMELELVPQQSQPTGAVASPTAVPVKLKLKLSAYGRHAGASS